MKHILTILSLITAQLLAAQEYFQQEVNYMIDIELDDVNHTLSGNEEFEYINHSPNELNEIYIHLWPNAYKNGKTQLAKQQYNQGEELLKFGNDSLKGWIDSLDFHLNSRPVEWEYLEDQIDVCKLHLPTPLKPGERISVSTPFRVQIPSGDISRLGHVGQSYQITQWYPKPAVYDKDGWHPISYLGQGEFYSEYGSFDVSITLPENYVVGATGDLQTQSEIEFLDELADKTRKSIPPGLTKKSRRPSNAFPTSSNTTKTIRYKQSNVHDFAWFADKRYRVLKSEVKLPHSERSVTTWAMYTPKNEYLWQRADEYLNDATYYYSLWNGDYPYNQVTAVDGTISAGGGMEYPNVTVIGNSGNAQQLEVVIVHEVGHNWFYGQLGSNERVHGWMDEGMNTLNEVRYMQTKYPENTAMSDMVLNGTLHFDGLSHYDLGDYSYRTVAWLGEDQPIETHSAEFTSANYGIIMYQKTGLVFFYLKAFLGDELFDECMRKYYQEWEFKHPQPEDMRASLERSSGKDLGWLFDELIPTTRHVDFKIKSVYERDDKTIVEVKNVGQVNGPVGVASMRDQSVVDLQWKMPVDGTATFEFETSNLVESYSIDPYHHIPEINRSNNNYRKDALFHKAEKVKFEFGLGDHESDRKHMFWLPVMGGNAYDKFMLGLAIHNYGVPPKKWSYFVAPLFSFGRRMVSGISDVNYTMHPKKGLKLSRFGLTAQSFKHDDFYRRNESHYIALKPYWIGKIGNRDKKAVPYTQRIKFQGIYRKDRFGPTHFDHLGAYADYTFDLTTPDHYFMFSLRNEYFLNPKTGNQLSRGLVEATYKWKYLRKKQKKHIEVRLFYGNQYISQFSTNGALPGQFGGYQYAMSLSGTDGQQDLFLDNFFFGRNHIAGIWSQQRAENIGGFRSTSNYGTTNLWLTSANIWLQLPYVPRIIGVFTDLGAFHNGTSVETAANVGVGLRIKDSFGVYFPIWMSQELNNSFGVSKYAEKIRFTLSFNLINKSFNPMNLL